MISVTICSPSESLAAPWGELVQRASPNAFMNPAGLMAAEATDFAILRVLLAWNADDAEPRRLVGVWAVQRRRVGGVLPAILEALPHGYAFLSTPVLDPLFIDQVIPAFLNAIEQAPGLPNVVALPSFDGESQAYAAIKAALIERGGEAVEVKRFARPVVGQAFGVKRSGSTRKKLRQDWNRLSALGEVAVVNDRSPVGVAAAFETFLTLEAASWKGTQGTAVACDPIDAAFTRRMVRELAARGDASVAVLQVDGRPIAAQVLMYCGTTAYTWKIGYDAAFGKFSPGALLVDKVTEQLFAAGFQAIDSCSSENTFMSQLWSGRRTMVDMVIDVGPRRSLGFVIELPRQIALQRLRELRNWLRGWRTLAKTKKAPAAPHPVTAE
jgi:CelD/BcsL family acetyltransferase involved in cellulose biosynthesis